MTIEKIRTIIIYYIVWIFLFWACMKRIESRNNPTIKNITALRDKREREATRSFYFEGVHLLEEFLRSGKTPRCIFVREDVSAKYASLVGKSGCEVIEVTDSVYEKLTEEKAPQGIFTVADFLDNVHFAANGDFAAGIRGNSVMLVDMQDNGNVGTGIRTAAAMDCDVILCGKCADVYSPKTVRATMGALFTNTVYICPDTSLAVGAVQKSGRRVLASALDENAVQLGSFDIKDGDCFAVGNEGQGLDEGFIAASDMTVYIPMSAKTESLNAASAASMLMWEAKRSKR